MQASKGNPPAKDDANLFTDDDMEGLRKNNGAALLYAWSPHMPISYSGFAMAQKVAEQNGLTFVPILDPVADTGAAARGVKQHALPPQSLRRIQSVELTYRGMLLHYPCVMVVRNGVVSGIYPGLAPSERALENFVNNFDRVNGKGASE